MRASLLPSLTFLATLVTLPAEAQVQDRPVPEASTCVITFTMSNSSDAEVAVEFRRAREEGDRERAIAFPRFARNRGPIVYVPARGTATYEWRSPAACGSYWQYTLDIYAGPYLDYEWLVPQEGATSSARVDIGDVGEPLQRRGRLDLLERSSGPNDPTKTRIGYRTLYSMDWGRTGIEPGVPLGEVEVATLRAPGTTNDFEYLEGEISSSRSSRLSGLELGDTSWFRVHLPESLGSRFTVLLDWDAPSGSTLLFAPVPSGIKSQPVIPGFHGGDGHHFSVSSTGQGLGIAPDRGSGLDGHATFGLDTLQTDGYSRLTLSFEVNGDEVTIYQLYGTRPLPILTSTSRASIPRTDAIDFYYEARGDQAKGLEMPPERGAIHGLRVISGTDVPAPPPVVSLEGEWQMVWNGRDDSPASLDRELSTEAALDPELRVENGVRLRVSGGEGVVSRLPADTSSDSDDWFRDPDLEVGFARWSAIQPAGEFNEIRPGTVGGGDRTSVRLLNGAFAVFEARDRIRVYRFHAIAPAEVWERVGSVVADSDGAAGDGSLQGGWVRRDSNNPRNDGMRIELDGGEATLTYLPPAGSRLHQVGQIQWQDVTGPGTMRVRGSDGRYYDAQLTMEGPDRVHIDIDANGPGNDQTWVRAGPSYDGEWVLARSTDGENEGLRIQVAGDQGVARFLPPTAARALRVGSSVWSGIAADGSLEALGGSGDLTDASLSLEHEDVVRVTLENGETQLWVRADALDGLPDGLLDDLAGGRTPEQEDTPTAADDLPEVDVPDDPEPASAVACAAPSSPEPVGPVPGWSWALDAQILPDGSAPRSNEEMPGARSTVVDIDRSFATGAPPHFSTLSASGMRYARAYRSERELTSSELDAAVTSARDAGEVIADFEAYATDGEMRYAAVFRDNPRGFAWSAQPGLTRAELASAIETRVGQGYRIADLEAYPTPDDGVRFAAVWYRTCDPTSWSHAVDVDGQRLQAMSDSLADHGFRLNDIEPYPSSDGTRYAALWEPVPADRGWEVHWDQSLTWFLNFHRRHVDEGMRLLDYEAFETPDGVRYAGIWVEHDARYDFVARDSIQAVVERHVRDNDLPGVSVAVIRDGDVLYRGGFGWADRAADKTAHSGTVYLAASASKAFGGTLAARLEERGQIDLSRPTADYVRSGYTYVPNLDRDIACSVEMWAWACEDMPDRHTHTVEQLLAKTACIHQYQQGPEPPTDAYRWRAEALVEIWDEPLLPNCQPGATYHYSTHGFTYAGAALEAATGRDMASLIRDELAQPLGLGSLRAMYQGGALRPDYDRATPYKVANRDSLPHPQRNPTSSTSYSDNSWKILGGGLEMNALDLATFGWKTLNGEIVSPTVRDDRLWTSLTDNATRWADSLAAPAVGLAWSVDNDNPNARRAWHHGSWRGARSHLEIWRDEGLVVAIMSNRRDHDIRSIFDLADEIRAAIRALDP